MSETITAASSARQRLLPLVLLAFALALIIAGGTVGVLALNELREATTRSRRSLEVRAVLKDIDDRVEDGGRDQRMYRLFGDPRNLAAYQARRGELPPLLRRLRNLFAADQRNHDELGRLESLIDDDNRMLATTLAATAPQIGSGALPTEFAAAFVRNDAIVAVLNEMLANESGLLDERFAIIASRDTILQVTVILGTVGSVVLIGVIIAMLRRNLRRSEDVVISHSGALLESEQRFRRIFEESPVGIVLVEQESARIVQANPAFCQTLRNDTDHVIGRTIVELAHLDRASYWATLPSPWKDSTHALIAVQNVAM